MDSRLRAVCDLSVTAVREEAGLHEYDGLIPDLSVEGIRAGLSRLGGKPLDDPHDEAHLAAFENHLRFAFGELELHRREPLIHLEAMDLAAYDRDYAPEAERAEARRRHLGAWPDAVHTALATLDAVPAPVAQALLPTAQGLIHAVPDDDSDLNPDLRRAAADAHARLIAHLERAARDGNPDPALGGEALARLMGIGEAIEPGSRADLGALASRADAERDRLMAGVEEACERLGADRPVAQVLAEQLSDHPGADGIVPAAEELTREVIAFTAERGLVPYLDGECSVGLSPDSRRWAMAMMSWAAPGETDAASWYHVTPPSPDWERQEAEQWLQIFSATTLPAITVHEVAPGHFAHGRALRRAPSEVRRVLHSMSFAEGWAHYVEEVCLEEGFRGDDPRFALGVYIEALVRVTRLACAIGLHSRTMSVDDAARRFESDAFLAGPAAMSEARRGTFDATYGRYTWGKFAILDLREQARSRWGADFSLARFHAAMLDLGSPPLGLIATAVERG